MTLEQHRDQNGFPETFSEMLDTSTGTLWQRGVKAWIRPRNPEGTIALLEKFQVDHFLLFALFLRNTLKRNRDQKQKNYFLRDQRMCSLLEFATNQTTSNESWHLMWLLFVLFAHLSEINTSHPLSSYSEVLIIIVLQTYAVLGQRYSRARLSIAIDRGLKRDRIINAANYENKLKIILPDKK